MRQKNTWKQHKSITYTYRKPGQWMLYISTRRPRIVEGLDITMRIFNTNGKLILARAVV